MHIFKFFDEQFLISRFNLIQLKVLEQVAGMLIESVFADQAQPVGGKSCGMALKSITEQNELCFILYIFQNTDKLLITR